jgi:hypothetical protein
VELTPGVVIIVAVVAVGSFVLIRWARRHEAAPPAEAPHPAVRSSTMAAREERESQPLVNWLLDRAFEQTGVSVADDALARERIVQAAVQAVEDLRAGEATISLPFLIADARGPKHFIVRFKRNPDSTFELQR